jgi:hypothetical protein
MRLRELLGLENPILVHPLMEAPFDRLPDPVAVLPVDELMAGTLDRVRQDWPEFAQVTALEALQLYARHAPDVGGRDAKSFYPRGPF